jgi:hypothetical protein
MNDAGDLRRFLFAPDWPQDEANQRALSRARTETADPSWHTIFVCQDFGPGSIQAE